MEAVATQTSLNGAKASAPKPTTSKRTAWQQATFDVRVHLAEAIEILCATSESAKACVTPAEKAVHDLGAMLGERMLPAVFAVLEPAPIYQDTAATASDMLCDSVQILEALTGIAVGSPFEALIASANALVLKAWDPLSDTTPWPAEPAPKAKKSAPLAKTHLHDFSFITQLHTKRGRYVSTCYFDVPNEDYGQGWHTGMKAAAEFMAGMASKTLNYNALDVICEASAAARERGEGINRRGAGVGFLRILEEMLRWSAISAPHQTYIGNRIARQVQIDAELDGRVPRRLLAPLGDASC